MHPHVVRVDHLPAEGDTFDLRFDGEEATALLRDRGIPPAQSVREFTASGRVFPSGGDVYVLGELQGTLTGTCSRCLEECEQPLAGEFHLTFVHDDVAGEGGETELHREDLDLEILSSGDIDLGEVVAEQVFLNLPTHPVCSTECRGLCPVCGGNRNRVACDCSDPTPDPRFAALAGLRRAGTEPED